MIRADRYVRFTAYLCNISRHFVDLICFLTIVTDRQLFLGYIILSDYSISSVL